MLPSPTYQSSPNSPMFDHKFTGADGRNYRILPLEQKDFEEVLTLIADLFIGGDVIYHHLKMDSKEYAKAIRPWIQRCVDDKLGIIIKDEKEKIIATLTSVDELRAHQEPVYFVNPDGKLNDTIQFYESIDPKYSPTQNYEIIYAFIGVTHPDYRRLRIQKILIEFLVYEHPIGSKSKIIYAQSPGRFDFTKIGWKQLDAVDPKKFVNAKGEKPFEGIDSSIKALRAPVPYLIPLWEFRREVKPKL